MNYLVIIRVEEQEGMGEFIERIFRDTVRELGRGEVVRVGEEEKLKGLRL